MNESPLSDSKVQRGSVERVHAELRDMAAAYQLRPGERLNEGALSRQLGVSRTPVREALNRLTAEGFLTFEPGKGFFCRPLEPKHVFDLYELREGLERTAVRLAVARAGDDDLAALEQFLAETSDDHDNRTPQALVSLDEHFHEGLAALSGNAEILKALGNVNARIRFVRWIDMEHRRATTQGEHRGILAAIRRRDTEQAVQAMVGHIERRLDQITAALKEGYWRIYLGSEDLGSDDQEP